MIWYWFLDAWAAGLVLLAWPRAAGLGLLAKGCWAGLLAYGCWPRAAGLGLLAKGCWPRAAGLVLLA